MGCPFKNLTNFSNYLFQVNDSCKLEMYFFVNYNQAFFPARNVLHVDRKTKITKAFNFGRNRSLKGESPTSPPRGARWKLRKGFLNLWLSALILGKRGSGKNGGRRKAVRECESELVPWEIVKTKSQEKRRPLTLSQPEPRSQSWCGACQDL